MASSPLMPPNRHIPYRKEGMVPAIITLVATAAVFLGAFAIHRATYREPTDVMMRQRGDQPAAHGPEGASGGHGAAPTTGAPAQGTPGGTH